MSRMNEVEPDSAQVALSTTQNKHSEIVNSQIVLGYMEKGQWGCVAWRFVN